MTTTPAVRSTLTIALVAMLTLILAACSSGAAASASPSAPSSSPPQTSEQPSDQPSPTDPDAGVVGPSDPGLGGGDGPKIVVPRPGTLSPRPVAVERIEPSIDGRHVTVKLTWTSGVEPCYQLDSVVISRDANDIALTVVEGQGQADVFCVEIALQKATIVDLGELEPGDYTISATNSDIPPVTITVS